MDSTPRMLSVAEAQSLVLQRIEPLPARKIPLNSIQGLVLADNVAADRDLPPFDKSLMDGYAVRSADFVDGKATLTVVDEVMAGQSPRQAVGPDQATRIMTGAPLPEGADAVVMVERTVLTQDKRVQIQDRIRPGQNIMKRGQEMRSGNLVIGAGAVIRPQECGILAGVGCTAVPVHPAPVVAILSTGDEIVEPDVKPGPAQIRNGNGYMLLAQAIRAGAVPRFLGIARDEHDHLRNLVTQGLEANILVLSGGVSAGQRDLVPAVLAEVGVQAIFHKVEMKPGKPVYFGIRPGHPLPSFVFGLPGNPVSSMVCFELFVRPAIRKMQNHADPGPCLVKAMLEEDYPYRSDRPTYHPARLRLDEDRLKVRVVPWQGSSDLTSVAAANAFVVFPPGDHQHRAGQTLSVLKVE